MIRLRLSRVVMLAAAAQPSARPRPRQAAMTLMICSTVLAPTAPSTRWSGTCRQTLHPQRINP
jgi:hypothetical protein